MVPHFGCGEAGDDEIDILGRQGELVTPLVGVAPSDQMLHPRDC
ncbi:hypothetical protein A4U53_019775 [Rhizobium ruizarguesonis]|uniref:Uncharacterized protein n=1 Tax=Rhizobium ruizarguesonis TaxID=2081791 RepID=A0ACD5ETU7_9HYPH|nr:hypothetical protein [Rhizobium leguminosarum]